MKVQSSRDKKDPEVCHQLVDTAERAMNLRQEARSQLGGGHKSHSSPGGPSAFLSLGFLDSKRKESLLECLEFPSDVIIAVPSGTTSEDQKPKDITLTRRTPWWPNLERSNC